MDGSLCMAMEWMFGVNLLGGSDLYWQPFRACGEGLSFNRIHHLNAHAISAHTTYFRILVGPMSTIYSCSVPLCVCVCVCVCACVRACVRVCVQPFAGAGSCLRERIQHSGQFIIVTAKLIIVTMGALCTVCV